MEFVADVSSMYELCKFALNDFDFASHLPVKSFSSIQMGRRRKHPKHVVMRVVRRRLKLKDFAIAMGHRNTVADILDVRAGLDKVDFVSLMVDGHRQRKNVATKGVLEG